MLNNWLQAVQLDQVNNFKGIAKKQFGKSINIFYDQFPDLSTTQIAIFGVGDPANTLKIRNELYRLSFPFKKLRITDLGNARKDDPSFVIPIIKELLVSGIFPIIISPSEQTVLAQFLAYQSRQQLLNLVCIDEKIQINPRRKAEAYPLNKVLKTRKPQLFHLSFIGYQSHFVDPQIIRILDRNNFDHFRLGNVRSALEESEPIIRDADLLSFNVNAFRQSDAPGQNHPSPCGLFIEEGCQISRYAGLSDKLTSIGFWGYQHKNDQGTQTAQVIAQLIWYFIDGFYNRKNDYPSSTDGLVEYIVNLKGTDHQVTFWKSSKSGRWWMQVPVKVKKRHLRHKLIPCSYNDYKLICEDDFPDRLFNAYKRFS